MASCTPTYIEGGGDAAHLRHTHRARIRPAAPLPTPAHETGLTGGGGRQRHTVPIRKACATRRWTADPGRTARHCPTAGPRQGDRQEIERRVQLRRGMDISTIGTHTP